MHLGGGHTSPPGLFGTLEMKIAGVERFQVRIHHPDGRDVRSDRTGMPSYPWEKGAYDSWTVARWKQEQFSKAYPGFDVEVLDGDNLVVSSGQTLLETVRDTYD